MYIEVSTVVSLTLKGDFHLRLGNGTVGTRRKCPALRILACPPSGAAPVLRASRERGSSRMPEDPPPIKSWTAKDGEVHRYPAEGTRIHEGWAAAWNYLTDMGEAGATVDEIVAAMLRGSDLAMETCRNLLQQARRTKVLRTYGPAPHRDAAGRRVLHINRPGY